MNQLKSPGKAWEILERSRRPFNTFMLVPFAATSLVDLYSGFINAKGRGGYS